MPAKALTGIRILDLTRILAGPYCSMLFADLGAEVIKIEEPGGEIIRDNPPLVEQGKGGPDHRSRSGYFLSLNRNKYGITLNLKHPKGLAIFKELVKIGDVVLENYAPGVMKKLGIDYAVLQGINPRLVMASISGYGQWGPYSDRISFDLLAQAMSGLMSITGLSDGPPVRAGVSLGDLNASTHCAFALMVALWHREKTGEGQYIDVSMQEAMVSLMEGPVVRWTVGKELLERIGSYNQNEAPMGAFRCKDGYLIIAVVGDEHWQRFCRAIAKPEWGSDAGLRTKAQRWEKKFILAEQIEKWAADYTMKEVSEMLDKERVANSPILSMKEVVEDPHLQERKYFVEVDHPIIGKAKLAGIPYKLSETPGSVERPSPLVGEHNELILGKYLGYRSAEIDELKKEGVL